MSKMFNAVLANDRIRLHYNANAVPLDPHAIHIHADGSCLKNPGGCGGVAAIVVYPEHLNLEPDQRRDSVGSPSVLVTQPVITHAC